MAVTPNNEPPLIQPLNLTQPPPPPVAPPPPRVDDAGATPRAAKSADAQRSENQSKPESPTKATASENDPMRELLDRMERLAPMVVSIDPALARTLRGLSQRGADPDQRAQPGFRNDVAYALQDLEKSPVGRLEIPPLLRNEMMQLAGTAVGLTNERMQALIAATASIQDRLLVADIRGAGKEIGLRVDQSHPEVDGRIATLENRARLTARPAEPEVAARTPGCPTLPEVTGRPTVVREGPGSGLGGLPNGAPPNGNLNGGSYQNRNTSHGEVTIQHSVLDTLLRAMRPDARQAQPPWEPPRHRSPIGSPQASCARK